jgi:hypothetical protein
MATTGFNSEHLDKMMGLAFEDLDHLSMRDQRIEFKKRATEMRRLNDLKFKHRQRGQGARMQEARFKSMQETYFNPPYSSF